MSFTPGPWRVEVSTDTFGWRNYAINRGAHDGDEHDTAMLISAAPDLLRELKKLVVGTEADMGHDAARAAISKAEGRE